MSSTQVNFADLRKSWTVRFPCVAAAIGGGGGVSIMR